MALAFNFTNQNLFLALFLHKPYWLQKSEWNVISITVAELPKDYFSNTHPAKLHLQENFKFGLFKNKSSFIGQNV